MQIIGQSQSDEWLLRLDDGQILAYVSELEAIMGMSRLATARAVVQCVQALAAPMDAAPDMWQEFWDVVNGSGSYIDDELEPLGITAAQLTSCVTVLENFNKFMQGETPAVDAYRVPVNTMRRVGAQI